MDLVAGIQNKLVQGRRGRFLVSLAVLLLLAGCTPPSKTEEEQRRELQGLKAEITAIKEKLSQLEAGQENILSLLQKPGAMPGALPQMQPPVAPPILSVSQLLAEKDRYAGTRVTVKGPVGPVLVHHRSLLLKAPEGMVEVLFGSLPDEKMVQRLTSTTFDNQVLTVTGLVSAPPKGGAKLQIVAEAVEF